MPGLDGGGEVAGGAAETVLLHRGADELAAELGGAVSLGARDHLVVYDDPAIVRGLQPDFATLAGLDRFGIIVTAPGDDGFDCISRFFCPGEGIDEDPVTGSAHCTVAPYWAARLGKPVIRAYQASARGGILDCTVVGDRVTLTGDCAFYLEGKIDV